MTHCACSAPGSGRLAAIDIGTNSVLLLVAKRAGAVWRSQVDRAVITRLGQGVDETRRLQPEATTRTLECLRRYAEELDALHVSEREAVGTSALRDASGGEEFLARAQEILGVRPRVLSGEEEARLTFAGAVSGLACGESATVIDIGGGSTEVIAGQVGSGCARCDVACSINVGAIRLQERHVKHDPPTSDELRCIRSDVRSQLPAVAPYGNASSVVGVAGTVTTLFAVSEKLVPYDGARVHGGRLTREQIQLWSDRFAHATLSERRKFAGLETKRADVIGTGTLIVLEVLDWLGATDLIVSDRGLRWGLIEQRERNQ